MADRKISTYKMRGKWRYMVREDGKIIAAGVADSKADAERKAKGANPRRSKKAKHKAPKKKRSAKRKQSEPLSKEEVYAIARRAKEEGRRRAAASRPPRRSLSDDAAMWAASMKERGGDPGAIIMEEMNVSRAEADRLVADAVRRERRSEAAYDPHADNPGHKRKKRSARKAPARKRPAAGSSERNQRSTLSAALRRDR